MRDPLRGDGLRRLLDRYSDGERVRRFEPDGELLRDESAASDERASCRPPLRHVYRGQFKADAETEFAHAFEQLGVDDIEPWLVARELVDALESDYRMKLSALPIVDVDLNRIFAHLVALRFDLTHQQCASLARRFFLLLLNDASLGQGRSARPRQRRRAEPSEPPPPRRGPPCHVTEQSRPKPKVVQVRITEQLKFADGTLEQGAVFERLEPTDFEARQLRDNYQRELERGRSHPWFIVLWQDKRRQIPGWAAERVPEPEQS